MPARVSALGAAQQKVDALLETLRSDEHDLPQIAEQVTDLRHLISLAVRDSEAAPEPALDIAEEAYFVGHAMHELRTPMTSIRGYADMLATMTVLDDMQQQFVSVIRTNAQRMESLLADVSLVSKIRKRTLSLSSRLVLFKNVAMQVEKDMMPIAQRLNRHFVLDVANGLPLLNIDSDMLALALEKLVENGLRYSSEDEGRVMLRARADDGSLLILVEDNGIGMTADELEKLGTIYFRADHPLVREYKGSGLGIPIAFGLAELSGGHISVTSTPGLGTTFSLRLPGLSQMQDV